MSCCWSLPVQASNYNVCSFTEDGELRWTQLWNAIRGEANGGMRVFDSFDAGGFGQPFIFALDDNLLAVGVKSGNIHVAAVSQASGAETIALTDTGRAYHTAGAVDHIYQSIIANGKIVFYSERSSGGDLFLERYEVASDGTLSFSQSDAITGGSLATTTITPSGVVLAAVVAGLNLVVVSLDSGGETGREELTGAIVDPPTGVGVTGTAELFGEADDFWLKLSTQTNPGDRNWWHDTPPFAPGSFANTYPATSKPSDGVYAMSAVDAEHAWAYRTGGPVRVRYFDVSSDSIVWELTDDDLYGVPGGAAFIDWLDLGPDNLLYFCGAGDGGHPKFAAVTSDGVAIGQPVELDEVKALIDVYIHPSEEGIAEISWKANDPDISYRAGQLRRFSGVLLRKWEWCGAPRMCHSIDGDGHRYFANFNDEPVLPIDGLVKCLDLEYSVLSNDSSGNWAYDNLYSSGSGFGSVNDETTFEASHQDVTLTYDSVPERWTGEYSISSLVTNFTVEQEFALFADGTTVTYAQLKVKLTVSGAIYSGTLEITYTKPSANVQTGETMVMTTTASQAARTLTMVRTDNSEDATIEFPEAWQVDLTVD